MVPEKDIRFTEKKVDESWKEQTTRDKDVFAKTHPQETRKPSPSKTLKSFLNLLTSLGIQAMMHLGEIPSPDTQLKEPNLEAAREIIELLLAIREKTEGNLSSEEKEVLESLIPELQMKFAQKV